VMITFAIKLAIVCFLYLSGYDRKLFDKQKVGLPHYNEI